MGEVIKLPFQTIEAKRNRTKIEYHIRAIERILPYLRKHVAEQLDMPSSFHRSQVEASLARMRESLDYIQYYLRDEDQKLIK